MLAPSLSGVPCAQPPNEQTCKVAAGHVFDILTDDACLSAREQMYYCKLLVNMVHSSTMDVFPLLLLLLLLMAFTLL